MTFSRRLLQALTMLTRAQVASDKQSWDVEWPDYKPTPVHVDLSGKSWADPEIGSPGFNPKFNEQDSLINRVSYSGLYKVVKGYPLNPNGRTGASLRGRLGKWGPNHAADSIVTKWKRHSSGEIVRHENTGKPILSFIAIKRRDTGDWALPGGNVDAGEDGFKAAKREFLEEALDYINKSPDEKKQREHLLEPLFSKGIVVFKGIVDKDPRNTDNAWMETIAYNFHDEHGTLVDKLDLKAGDDAVNIDWKDISCDLKLYASHSDLVKNVAIKHDAHW